MEAYMQRVDRCCGAGGARKRRGRWRWLGLGALLLGAGFSGSLSAAELELAFGAATSDQVPTTFAGWMAWLSDPRQLRGDWQWRAEAVLLGVGAREQAGRRYDVVAVAGAGLRLEGKRLFVGGALAFAHDTTPQLSSHHQFISTLGWRFGRGALVYRHISNGSTRKPNRGEDMVALTVRFGGTRTH